MSIVVVGADKLIYRFKEIDTKVQTEVIDHVLDEAADEMKNVMSENAPEGPGNHGDHLKDEIEVAGKGHERKVGPSRDAFWGKFVEKGVPKERVTKDRSTTGHFQPAHSTGTMPAEPFMEPSIDDPRVKERATNAFRERMATL